MERHNPHFLDIFSRYLILLLVASSNLALFYFIFTPLTVYASYFLLGLFFPVSLSGTFIILNDDFVISLIPACVAGAAYYLLFILNLSTPNIKISKRIFLILIAFFSFWAVNVTRIFFLSVLYFDGSPFFDFLHKFLWYFGSVILTAGIWFLEVHFFKLEGIPFYSDLKFLYKQSFFNKKWH
jgi:exosortase/archaeosortase family protein